MSKDLTNDELDRELARMAGRPAPASRAPLALSEAEGDITGDELDVALARLTGRSVPARLAEAAERDGATREAARKQAMAPTSTRPRTLADAAYEERRAARPSTAPLTVTEGRRVVPITEVGSFFRVIGGMR